MLETRDSSDLQMTESPFLSPSSSPTQNGDPFLPPSLSAFVTSTSSPIHLHDQPSTTHFKGVCGGGMSVSSPSSNNFTHSTRLSVHLEGLSGGEVCRHLNGVGGGEGAFHAPSPPHTPFSTSPPTLKTHPASPTYTPFSSTPPFVKSHPTSPAHNPFSITPPSPIIPTCVSVPSTPTCSQISLPSTAYNRRKPPSISCSQASLPSSPLNRTPPSPYAANPCSSPLPTPFSSNSPPLTPSPKNVSKSPSMSPKESDLQLQREENLSNSAVSFTETDSHSTSSDHANTNDVSLSSKRHNSDDTVGVYEETCDEKVDESDTKIDDSDEKMDDSDDIIDVIGDDEEDNAQDEGESSKNDEKDNETFDRNSDNGSDVEEKRNTTESDADNVSDSFNNNNNRQMSPTSLTNFSIAAILKPEFGARKLCLDFQSKPHPPCHSRPHSQPIQPTPHRPHPLLSFSIHSQLLHHNHNLNLHRQQLLQHQQNHHQRLGSSSPVDLTMRRGLSSAGKVSSEHRRPDGRRCSDEPLLHGHSSPKKDKSDKSRSERPQPLISSINSNNNNINNERNEKTTSNNSIEKKARVANSNNTSNNNCNNNSNNQAGSAVDNKNLWPAWVFCTRYSDRPSSGPRTRKIKRKERTVEEKRPRTAFTNEQLSRLKREFDDCRYLTENRRRYLASELGLTEAQIKIWFQNKRAKIKKSSGMRNPLAVQLMAQGLYNHSTVTIDDGDVREMDDDD